MIEINSDTILCTDSRSVTHPAHTLFFALPGRTTDGHRFIPALYQSGVRHFVVREVPEEALPEAVIEVVPDVLQALQTCVATYRKRNHTTEVVAITGSNGKTIVKEWLYRMLAPEGGIYRSPMSYNSQLGVPLSVSRIQPTHRIALIEAGISKPGEMERLEPIIAPKIGIFTHFGKAHDEHFPSSEAKWHEKFSLFSHCELLIGEETPEMRRELKSLPATLTPFLWSDSLNTPVDVRVTVKGNQLEISFKGETATLTPPSTDSASVENVMNCVCYMLTRGYTLSVIAERVHDLSPLPMRLEVKRGIHDSLLICDYYNSDPEAFLLALRHPSLSDRTRERTVILSDFSDFQNHGEVLYTAIAEEITRLGINTFCGIGPNLCRFRQHFPANAQFYNDTNHFLQSVKSDNFVKQTILLKGSRDFHFESIAAMLEAQSHQTTLEVNLDAMGENYDYFKEKAKVKMAVMLKAFAYGSGMVETARLMEKRGADYLMVAFTDEGITLREAGISMPIVVLQPEIETFDLMIHFHLEPTLHSQALFIAFTQSARRQSVVDYPVHIKLNTGMNRSGFNPEEIDEIITLIRQAAQILSVRSLFSHLAGSDDPALDSYTREQVERFQAMTNRLLQVCPGALRHILNSAGIERFPEYTFDMVRLGIGLHGITATEVVLQSTATLKSYISALRWVKKGDAVGYNRGTVLSRDTRVAIVSIGYADGLNRRLGRCEGSLFIRDRRVPILGNICMDCCMADVTDLNEVAIGETVEVFGPHITILEIARKLGTIPYEILTAVAARVPRVYVHS